MSTRNQPCACGSGKKTKRCCGDEAVKSRKYQDYLTKLRTLPKPVEDNNSDNPQPRRRTSNRQMIALAATAAALAWTPSNRRY